MGNHPGRMTIRFISNVRRPLFQFFLAGGVMVALLWGCQSDDMSVKKLPKKVDFNIHIKPIISDRCFKCHGPDENTRKGNLRLDIKEAAFALLDSVESRYALVPGSIGKSELAHRISSVDPDYMMPPPESNLSLSDREIALLKRWIEQGAEWKPHWAFIPPSMPVVPENKNSKWARNPIDHFVLDKMEDIGVRPSKEAEKTSLIRRLSFDLTGLPPTLSQVDDFVADESPDAYEKLVDQFLASPSYGERMGAYWLDVSRYADSHGYQDDRPRTMWPWRDWVIEAFNKNVPYNDFVTRQLAGDLMPNASFENKLASGFNRNHPITQEGGIIEEEYLTEYAADRAQTFSTAFLGLTMQCARCHDHKYDPISQKEFYQTFAFFNNNNERGQISYSDLAPKPSIRYQNDLLEAEVESVKNKINEYENELQRIQPETDESIVTNWFKARNWEALSKEKLDSHFSLDFQEGGILMDDVSGAFSGILNYKLPDNIPLPAMSSGKKGKALQFNGNNAMAIGDIGDFEFNESFSLGAWIEYSETPKTNAGILSRRNGEQNQCGYGLYLGADNSLRFQLVNSPSHRIEVRSTSRIPRNKWVNVYGTYDGSGRASGVSLFINGIKQQVEVLSDNLEAHSILVGTQFTVGNWMWRATQRKDLEGFKGKIDEISIYHKELGPFEVGYQFDGEPEFDLRIASQAYLKRENFEFVEVKEKLDSLRGIDIEIPNVMIMEELDSIKPAYVLVRGAYDVKGARVERGTPQAVLEFSDDLPPNRLGLAMWLFDEKNPLTSRVMVNRFWQILFGKGLVSTPEDFGNQGELPSHPELLDWMAINFMNSGWDMKGLIKLMVMSSTYRQSSRIEEQAYKRDPENIYLSRGPYKKITAEMIRDQALAASGLLNLKVGGKWVKPYQPAGIWEELANQIGENKYRPGKGGDLYRRSIYTYWKRTIPVPSMLTFDASERAVCTVKRQSTSTPLQSLVLLNDIQYVEASRRMAESLIRSAEDEPSLWIENLFRRLATRNPTEEETHLLLDIYTSELQRFQGDEDAAEDLINIGDSPVADIIDKIKLAALTVVANAILNLDETKHS